MGNFFGGYTASAFRSIMVILLLLPLAFIYRKFEAVKFRDNWRYLAGMIFASLFIWGPLYYSILHAGIGISISINYASYVIGAFFFGWLLVGERFTRIKLFSALLGIIGIGLVFSPSIAGIGLAALMAAAISGVAASANVVIAKQIRYNATQSTLALWAASLIANTIMALLVREMHPAIGLHIQWLYLVAFSIASVIATWTLIAGLKLIDAGAAGILGLLEIVFAVIFGVIFFSERPGPEVLAGVTIILVAASIPYFQHYNSQKA